MLVDTGVFYAHHDRDAEGHEDAKLTLTRALQGEYGEIYTTDYVYDETVTLTRARTGSYEAARKVGDRLRETSAIKMVNVSEEMFEASVERFHRYRDHGFSFTDAATVAVVEEMDQDQVMSFDDDFDGVVDRVDPTEVR